MPLPFRRVSSWPNLNRKWYKENIDWDSLISGEEWKIEIIMLLEQRELLKEELKDKTQILEKGAKIFREWKKEAKKMKKESYYEKWLIKETEKIQNFDKDEEKKEIQEKWTSKEREIILKLVFLLEAKSLEIKNLTYKIRSLEDNLIFEKKWTIWHKNNSQRGRKEWWKKTKELIILKNSKQVLEERLLRQENLLKNMKQTINYYEKTLKELKNTRTRTIITSILVSVGVFILVIKFFHLIKNKIQKNQKVKKRQNNK